MPNTTTPTTTDTPRTDALFYSFHSHDDLVEFARSIERELAQCLKLRLQLMKHLNEQFDEIARLNRHLSGV